MKSGISDYSEILIYGLQEHFDITLLIDDYQLENKQLYKDFNVRVYGKDKVSFNLFDHRLYNIGNNPDFHGYIYECALKNPGLIMLHDFSLYYLFVGYYKDVGNLYSKIYAIGGSNAVHRIKPFTKQGIDLLEFKHLAPDVPLNKELICSDNKIVVHSDYTYDRVYGVKKNENGLRKINHVDLIDKHTRFIDKRRLFSKYDIPEDFILLCSFGSIDRTKLNHVICEAVNELNGDFGNRLIYLMVGEGDYVNDYMTPGIRKTGYVDLVEFNSFIKHCNVVINLRYPSMGETSGAVIRALSLGKPCIVSDDAWFSELPSDVVLKLANNMVLEDLSRELSHLLKNPERMKKLSEGAERYIKKDHNIEKVSREIMEFLNKEDTL